MRNLKTFCFCAWTAVVNMRPPKSWWVTLFSFCMVHIYIYECFDCFRKKHSLTIQYYQYCCCIVAIYDVRGSSSHIVSIRTGLKSRLIWDWSAVIHTIWASSNSLYTCKMGRDLVRVAGDIRRSVHDYETSYAYDTCWGLMYGLSDWLKIRQKQLKARQSRQNQVYLALPSQKQVRCEDGQSQGSWCVSCTWF